MRSYIEHEGLARLLGDASTEVQYRMWRGLQEKYPQLNRHSGLSYVYEGREVEVFNPEGIEAQFRYSDYFIRLRGWKARLWRILGEIFNKRKWLDKGRRPLVLLPSKRIIRLERFGIAEHGAMGLTTTEIICGYDATSDTLFVRPQRER